MRCCQLNLLLVASKKSAPKTVPTLSKLYPRLNTLQTSLAAEMQKARNMVASKKRETDHAQKKVEDKDVAREAEQGDARSLEVGLTISMEVVTIAEDTADSVAQVSAPLVNEIADEIDATIAEPIKETETAQKAQVSLPIATKQVPFCLCVCSHLGVWNPYTENVSCAVHFVLFSTGRRQIGGV